MPNVTVNLTTVEDVCDELTDLHSEVFNVADLNGFERLLVLARLAHIFEQSLGRCLNDANRVEFEKVRAIMIDRAEQIRAANLEADATGINSEGGSA